MANTYDVGGCNALVTGAAGGIGLATAQLLADNGASVVIHDRDQQRCDAAAATLPNATGLACDLADITAIPDFCARVNRATQSRLDILVHNAGVFPGATLDEQSMDEWETVMQINAGSNFLITQQLLPCLRAAGSASVVLVSSVTTKMGRGDSPAYVASKAAQIGLSRHLAAELGADGIRVNIVMPGLVQTPGSRALLNDDTYHHFANNLQNIPVQIKAEHVAHAIVFLCTPSAGAITAASLDVNGGLRPGG